MNSSHSHTLTQRALILIEQSNFSEALKFIKQSLAIDPENAYALYLLALCQSQIPSEKKNALPTIEQALSIDSESVYIYALKTSLLLDKDKSKNALETAERAIRIDPDNPDGHIAKSRVLMAMEKWKEAEISIRKSLELDPDDIMAENLLTTILRFQNRGSETSEHIQSLLKKDPNNSYAHANAGWAALEQNDLKKAKFHFLEALRIDPEYDYARNGVIETFKAQSLPYRLYLKYCFAMSKLEKKNRIFFIFGILILVQILQRIFTGPFQILGTTIVILYFIFVLWSWLARGVGNFFLFLNSFARHALLKNEKIEAILVGGNVCIGIVAILYVLFNPLSPFFILAAACIGSAFPFSITFTNEHPTGRYFYGISGVLILLSGCCATLLGFLALPENSISPFMTLIYSLTLLSIWLGAFNVLRR